MAAGSKGVWEVVEKVRHRLGGGKEKGRGGGRGSNRFKVRLGFGQIGVDWSKWVEWIRVEWRRKVNAPRLTMGRN